MLRKKSYCLCQKSLLPHIQYLAKRRGLKVDVRQDCLHIEAYPEDIEHLLLHATARKETFDSI